ncbi:peptidase S8/S53, subtilisin/kexin/sedolisin [Purpureocillium lilacinum]|uniref:Peptidase S8/S53, subtilisin/kexin/sedolisin n=1 Tax=Purpureocillium lilacinum TaxID=33203 RepID=A0A179GFV9_PURLI|nr:peptidase S8/S53, subtilisin/kexin/sedolisin [Purpureocillium lilacinum]OAQ76716.1 peptidase S8/S53, subtilisin/kexin/sedolisin [Purpureocillium lilacinum]
MLRRSDPDSPTYGHHYTKDQIRDLFSPTDESILRVRQWLVASGIPEGKITVSQTKSWVNFEASIGRLEQLLNAKYHVYDNLVTRTEHFGTDEYYLPEDLAVHIDFVLPGTAFSRFHQGGVDLKKRKLGLTGTKSRPLRPPLCWELPKADFLGSLADCYNQITPACIKAMYNIPQARLAHPSNKLGIYELNGDAYVQSDLDMFTKLYAPYVPPGTAPLVHNIDGSNGTSEDPDMVRQKAGSESMLDFEMVVPIIYPQGTVLYSVPYPDPKPGIFNLFLDALDGSYCDRTSHGYTGDTPKIDGVYPMRDCGTLAATNVISISYGFPEFMYPARYEYLERQCDEWMKLALAGITVVVASGDNGVAGNTNACLGKLKNIFVPDAVSSCPYVTSVGSTVLPPHKRPGDQETATTSFSSGGGFSNIFKTPSYQKRAVADHLFYFNPGYPSYNTSRGQIPKNGGIYNAQGRGFPDLSANGDNSAVITNGIAWLGGGTSQAAPIIAAMFNLVNEERLAANKSTIGFVNPMLYKHPEIFNDIRVGKQDKGGLYDNGCGNDGFQCGQGWDPVTGLGTPD